MKTRTIPDDQWTQYFDTFSRDHAGWRTTIEVLEKQAGPQRVANDLPLQGISFDTDGTRASTLDISLGDTDVGHVNHVVDLPLHIRQVEEPDGAIDLQIEPATGPVTLLHLQAPPVLRDL